jgi:hypothetical protein
MAEFAALAFAFTPAYVLRLMPDWGFEPPWQLVQFAFIKGAICVA